MSEQYSFEIKATCVVNKNDYGEPITEQKIQQDISDLLQYYLCVTADVVVTKLHETKSDR